MVLALLLVGLLPLALLGISSRAVVRSVLGLSLAPVDDALEHAGQRLRQAGLGEDAELGRAELYLAEAELARRGLLERAEAVFALTVGTAALLGVALAFVLASSFSRPIGTLTGLMAQVSRGELDGLPSPPGPAADDELSFLIAQFHRMTRELSAQRAQLEAAQKLAGWKDAARALAHELKNPLTAIRLALARIDRAREREGFAQVAAEATALLDEELAVLMRLSQSFSELAHLPPANPERVELRQLLSDVCALYGGLEPVAVTLLPGPELWLRADRDQLRRVFGNLVKNAVEASAPGDASVEVEGGIVDGTVRVQVRDRGCGLPERAEGVDAVLGRTTKAHGSGIGLPLAQTLVRAHGGTLLLERRPERGTVATVALPAEERGLGKRGQATFSAA